MVKPVEGKKRDGAPVEGKKHDGAAGVGAALSTFYVLILIKGVQANFSPADYTLYFNNCLNWFGLIVHISCIYIVIHNYPSLFPCINPPFCPPILSLPLNGMHWLTLLHSFLSLPIIFCQIVFMLFFQRNLGLGLLGHKFVIIFFSNWPNVSYFKCAGLLLMKDTGVDGRKDIQNSSSCAMHGGGVVQTD